MVRALHVLTLSADGREVLLAAAPGARPTHSVALDERLARVVRGEHPDGVTTPTLLSPRDIQARLRAGATVADVAAEAGVPAARVERYAGPVRSEQERVVAAAQAAVLRRPRAGLSAVPLVDAVGAHLAAMPAARPESASWSAARAPDGQWTLLLHVVVRGRHRAARWRFDAGAREVTALDSYAAQLGFLEATPAPPPRARRAPPRAR